MHQQAQEIAILLRKPTNLAAYFDLVLSFPPAFLFLPETVGRDHPFGDCRFGFNEPCGIICLRWFCPARAGEFCSRMAPRQQQGSADKG